MLKKILLTSALAFTLAVPAFSATTPNSFINVQAPASVTVNSTSSSFIVFTAGSNGSKCNGLSIATNSSTVTTLNIEISAGTGATITTISIPASAGTSVSVPPIAGMSSTNWPGLPTDSEGNPYLLLPASATVSFALSGASGSSAMQVYMSCGNF